MAQKIRIGLNGFGRIGRNATRIILGRDDLEIVAINSRSDSSSHAYLLQYDSTYGIFNKKVTHDEKHLYVEDKKIAVFAVDEPADIPWDSVGADIVIDATGKFRSRGDLEKHFKGPDKSVKKILLSSPAKDDIKTLVMGVNHTGYDPHNDHIISNSSCTTNCLSTTVKVLHDTFKIKHGFMTTTHAVTDSQNLLDNSHKKEVRLRRASFQSFIPASTGSAKDIGKLYPNLKGKIICQAIRVPVPTGSIINLTVEVEKTTTKEEVNKAFNDASNNALKGILAVAEDELVSRDYTGNTHSSIVDPFLTQVLNGTLVNVFAWYDNEWGYTNRLVDMAKYITSHLQ